MLEEKKLSLFKKRKNRENLLKQQCFRILSYVLLKKFFFTVFLSILILSCFLACSDDEKKNFDEIQDDVSVNVGITIDTTWDGYDTILF